MSKCREKGGKERRFCLILFSFILYYFEPYGGLGGPEEDHQLHHCSWIGRVGEREEEEEEEEEPCRFHPQLSKLNIHVKMTLCM